VTITVLSYQRFKGTFEKREATYLDDLFIYKKKINRLILTLEKKIKIKNP
jgi:hypothetical protein